ncbi:Hypothetical predicted protein [Lecanosticta acicola]|uniref:Rhodopsin domain-containing protein n=1 Tax=Lecanosticta acicola TaxID=111012 RepID=A0AAI8YRF9_9PEZI|nr:Hypothetical predicted protein [Lecanosticta acicola]
MLHTSASAVVVTIILLATISAVAVFCRLFSRFFLVHNGGVDDWIMLLALVFAIAMGAAIGMQVRFGLGQPTHAISPSEHEHFMTAFWASIWLYHIAVGSARFAIIFQCMRIFPQEAFGPAKWLMGSVLICNGIVTLWTTFGTIFTCVPPSDFWKKDGRSGNCFKKINLWVANSTLGMILDFAVAMLPIPWIQQLRLPRRQKILLGSVFVLAGLPCLLAVIRLQSLIVVAYAKDPAWDNPTLACFSASEVYIGIVFACLPTLKAFFTRIRGRIAGSPIYHKTKRACQCCHISSLDSDGAGSQDRKSQGCLACFRLSRRRRAFSPSEFENTIHLVDSPLNNRLGNEAIRVVRVVEQNVEIASEFAKPERALVKYDRFDYSHDRSSATTLSADAVQSSRQTQEWENEAVSGGLKRVEAEHWELRPGG